MPSYKDSPTGLALDVILVVLVISTFSCTPLFTLILVYIPDYPFLLHTLFITQSETFTIYHVLSVVGILFGVLTNTFVVLQQTPLAVFTLRK